MYSFQEKKKRKSIGPQVALWCFSGTTSREACTASEIQQRGDEYMAMGKL